MPLGINGDARHAKAIRVYPICGLTLCGRGQRGPHKHREVAALRRGGFGPRDPKGRRSNNSFISSILSCSSRALRGWAERPSAQARQPQRVARALPHHGKFAASGECNELRRVAVRRRGWRRTARLKEPQKQYPIHRPILRSSSSGAPPGARLRRSLRSEDGDSYGIALFTLKPIAIRRQRRRKSNAYSHLS